MLQTAAEQADLDQRVKEYEAAVNDDDDEQIKVLEAIKAHTKRIHYLKGHWTEAPASDRIWNTPLVEGRTVPLSNERYRAYKEHLAKEADQKQHKPLLQAAAEGST
ncbi:hypothetical protein WJX72_003458 [[Myrmecia] bisecta]|uniref:Uncharacterized protein n=1 Tax=[Myrmecia] bisecta TaxID=41462 RepID=A0AAW1QEN5_9CHLO